MEIRASHHFDRPLAEVWAMFLDPDAHVGKYAEMGHHDIRILSAEPGDDSLRISIVRKVDGDVPAIARKFIKPSNTITTTDRWQRDAAGGYTGHSKVDVRNVPVAASAEATLVADEDGEGCTYKVVLSVALKVPLVGERIAGAMRPQLTEQLNAEFVACDAWLARDDT